MKEWKEVIKISIGEEEFIEVLDFEYMDEVSEVPRMPGVYMFFAGHEKLYIGESSNLRSRIQGHISGSSATEKFTTQWTHVLYAPLSDGQLRVFIESLLIKTYKPTYNTTDMKRLVANYGDEDTVYDLIYYSRIANLTFDYIAEEFQVTRAKVRHFATGLTGASISLPEDYSPRKKLDMTRKRNTFTQMSKKKFYEVYDYLQEHSLPLKDVAKLFDVSVTTVQRVRTLEFNKYKRWIKERNETATV